MVMTSDMTSSASRFPQIDGYTLVECLYSSSQTQIYRALQSTRQQKVIIKVLSKEMPTQYELALIRNQYAIAKSLPIPGIIRPLSLESYEGGQALVMEDWGGVSLDRYNQPLSLIEILKIALQLADVLHDLHRHRVIHKDIKPTNILICPQSKQVRIIDFSAASALPKETQVLQSPQMLEGTLAYLSPEQTGRMNRGIDYRTDYYSLGVTLYQLLTGRLPFSGDDPLELIHCHLARMPVPVSQINSEVPGPVGAIIAKLMAKNAEERYQSALGLKHDLSHCLDQWQQTGAIADFALGQADVSDRFLIPEKLYGRESEVATLLATFERVAEGAAELMLVAGFSGIGKTVVVNEVHKPIVKRRGYFIKGKFDQFNRNVPLSAFVQALEELIGQLLSESDERLAEWRSQILAAVGDNGQVLIEVIPELEQIIGEQPPVLELASAAEQHRFNTLFQKFISVFTHFDHPLVVFLDDLQWADTASLALIERLMKQTYLLLLGAYRNNEVSPSHPLTLTVEALQQSQIPTHILTLAPLQFDHVNQLVAETLTYPLEDAKPLSNLIYQKAKGNAFFITQFLKALHSEGQLSFDSRLGRWTYDIADITALTLTEDVVTLMAQQLQKLPTASQTVLKLAACVGNQFELDTLAMVAQMSSTEVAQALWPALQEGMVLPIDQAYKFFQGQDASDLKQPINSSYRFLHDRIQQAAASLIAATDKRETHLKIGQLLLQNTPLEERENRVFDIVNHLNAGFCFDAGAGQYDAMFIESLARLNLMAGEKARKANAISTAAEYFTLGIEHLPEDGWRSCYSLAFDLHRESGKCQYLIGNFAASQRLLKVALEQATSDFDKAEIYVILMNLFMTQGDNFKAGIDAGLEGLALLGLSIPRQAIALQERLSIDQAQVRRQIARIEIAELYHHPVQTDPTRNLSMQLLVDLWALAYLDGNVDLLNMTVVQLVQISLQGGNTSLSAFGYVTYAMNLAFEQEYQTAYQLARLALALNKKFNRTDLVGKVNNLFCNAINPYNRPLITNLELYQESYQHCMACGDLTYGGWALFLGLWTRFDSGQPLPEVAREADRYLDAVEQMGDLNMHAAYLSLQRVVQNLQDESCDRRRLDNETFHEADCLTQWQENNFNHGLNWYHYLKAQVLYTYEQYGAALETFQAVEDKVAANVGFFPVTKYYFYYLLVLTALYPEATKAERTAYWPIIERHYAQLQVWADSCAENFQHQALLAAAEMARVCDRPAEAMDLYEQAIASAQESQMLHHEALANELAAKFYLGWNKEKCAAGYLQAAYSSYGQWGAKAKMKDLESRYAALLLPVLSLDSASQAATSQASMSQALISQSLTSPRMGSLSTHTATRSSSTGGIDPFDLAAVLKTSQSLSSEIELDRLLATVLHTALETAGANRGVLLMPQENQWFVEAIATVDRSPQLKSIALFDFTEIPQAVIRTVKRHLEPVVIDHAATDPMLVNDAYISRHAIKSLLCAPILRRGQLVALLYLENRMTVGAFTGDRVKTLQMIAAQAAISIVNARLYQQVEQHSRMLETEVNRQTQELCQKAGDLEQTLKNLKDTQSKLIQSEKMSALSQLVGGIAHEINNPINFIHGNLEHAKSYITDLLDIIALYQERYPQADEAIQAAIETADLEFVQHDSLRLFESMQTGTKRISQIILDLRNFSRLDEAELKIVDLHSGLESTLGLLQHRTGGGAHPAIRVSKQYSEIPLVTCYASQLNQVFFSLLSNAIDAIQGWPIQPSPTISISTQQLEDMVQVRIGDNGHGIPTAIKDRIFEPFFTTKPVGDGTGLGLSTSYAILKRHGGTIQCHSNEGVGTEMVIELPVRQPALLENSL